jgi:amino acid adenylation domain-containing protein
MAAERPEADLEAALRGLSPQRRRLVADELARRTRAAASIPLADRSVRPLPCSFGQQRLWFLDQADPGTVAYVMPTAVRLSGALDVAALCRSVEETVRRHEALRTGFAERDGIPGQVVRPAGPMPIPVIPLEHLGKQAAEAEVRKRYQEEVGRPFDLERDPLVRAAVLRIRPDEHVLLLSMHHIVSDGWSLGVFQHELMALYRAFARGDPAPALPELRVQYADFAVWQRQRMDSGELDGQLAYWRARLAGAPVLELSCDHSRPAVRSSRGASVPVRLSPAVVRGVERLAEEENATPYMVLVAAFTVMLSRWSGQRDMIVGSASACRTYVDLEPLIGFFVNTLPLRMQITGDPAFHELVRAARDVCLAAQANQDVPFERMVAEAGVHRAAGMVPLVQAMIALRNVPMSDFRLPGLQIRPLDFQTESAKFDLTFDLVPDEDGGITGRAEYSLDLFEADSVRRMAAAFALLLEAGLAAPQTAISRLPVVTAGERARIVGELSGGGSAAAARTAGTLHGLFERQAEAAPGAEAVAFGDRVLSYRELDEQANRLAWLLREHGAGPEQLVGVHMPRSELMILALLGILKAGAGYVPLDPQYPRDRVSYMAEDAEVSLILTHSSAPAIGPAVGADGTASIAGPRLICLDTAAGDIAAFPARRPPAVVAEPHLAYVIYTSGSTGRPKGSANEHGRVANTMHGVNGVYELSPADRMLAISSLNYDMSVYEIFGTLAAGATVVVPSDIEITDPEQLLDLLRRQRVTAWSSAPALLEMLVNHAHGHGGMPGVALRVVGLGGDRMPPALPGRLAELVPGVRLLNLAGMTEVSYCSTAHAVAGRSPAGIPWGLPLPNHRLYVLDRHGAPVPVGVPGELFIGGAGPGRGYWRRPGATAGRFLPDPFSPEPGGRMYATGDHARFLPNGDLDFLGRLDLQVKIRGFRIELGEIEFALTGHPLVGEPVVVAYTDAAGHRRLAAYLTARGDERPAAPALRAYLSERLPDFMVPSSYTVLDRLPLLPSGKLDRAALPAPAAADVSARYVPPADVLEQVLAGLLAQLLAIERVGADDDFFELGGHSLLATQAVSQIRDLFGVGLAIPGFLASRTVHGLAGHLRELGTAEGADVDQIAALALEVRELPEEEVRRQLAGH